MEKVKSEESDSKRLRSGNKLHSLDSEFTILQPIHSRHKRAATLEEICSEDFESEEQRTERRPIKGWYQIRDLLNPRKIQPESSFKRPKLNHSIDASPEDKQHVYDKFRLMQHMEIIKGQQINNIKTYDRIRKYMKQENTKLEMKFNP